MSTATVRVCALCGEELHRFTTWVGGQEYHPGCARDLHRQHRPTVTLPPLDAYVYRLLMSHLDREELAQQIKREMRDYARAALLAELEGEK